MLPDYDKIHAILDYNDGILSGVADLKGIPHYFERSTDKNENDDTDYFFLKLIDEQTLQLAMEDWAISQRWQSNQSSPEDSERDKEIRKLLAEKLTINPEVDIKAAGEFQPALSEIENKSLTDPIGNLQVRWHSVEAP